jgi:hypothetical protein
MVACSRRKRKKQARKKLAEIHTILEEDLHNVSLQEASKEEQVLRRMEEYHAHGAKIQAQPQWVREGDEPSKYYFDFLYVEKYI